MNVNLRRTITAKPNNIRKGSMWPERFLWESAERLDPVNEPITPSEFLNELRKKSNKVTFLMAGEDSLKGKSLALRLTHGVDHQMDIGKNRYEVFTLVFNKFPEQIMSAQTAESIWLNFSWRVTEYQFLFLLVLCVQCRNNCLLRIRTNLKHDSEDQKEEMKTGTFSPSKHVTLRHYHYRNGRTGTFSPSNPPLFNLGHVVADQSRVSNFRKIFPSKIKSTKIRKVNKARIKKRKSNHKIKLEPSFSPSKIFSLRTTGAFSPSKLFSSRNWKANWGNSAQVSTDLATWPNRYTTYQRVSSRYGTWAKGLRTTHFFLLEAAWLNEIRCPGGRPSVS